MNITNKHTGRLRNNISWEAINNEQKAPYNVTIQTGKQFLKVSKNR